LALSTIPPARPFLPAKLRAVLPEKKQVLIVDDEPNLRKILAAQLSRDGYEIMLAEDGEQGLAMLREHHIDLVVTDLKMPKVDGMALLREALRESPDLPIVMITAHGTVDTAVEALKLGAFDYLTKPFDKDEVRQVVAKALRTRALAQKDATPATPDAPHDAGGRFGIIGASSGLTDLYAVLERVADSPTTVLITGESGTGKELVARALHAHSARKDKPFIKVNCAAIPKELIESELFGYERGAFTGAVSSKPGRFELAHGGTLFLDEIGEIPVEMQVKLLRALQESEFERVGGIKTIHVDVRLVAATNRDLKKLIATHAFRDDLFYRLNVVSIRLPALRERESDVPLLVEHFLAKFNERLKKQVAGVEPEALAVLSAYPWPGNIRELENVMERAVLFCDGAKLRVDDLPSELRASRSGSGAPSHSRADVVSQLAETGEHDIAIAAEGGLKEHVKVAMNRLERELVGRALKQTGGNVTHAARLLKISRKGLQLKMKELGLREGTGEKGD
jgi:nitrogen regulation protein NR(I)